MTTNGPVDYREAFVVEIEMVAHSWDCRTCAADTLKNRPRSCTRFQYMQGIRDRAYEALPSYYKDRYDKAAKLIVQESSKAFAGIGKG